MISISVVALIAIIITVAVVSFIIAIFVYRNNTDIFAPIAERLDTHEDNLEEMIRTLKGEIKTLNKKVSALAHKN